MKFSREQRLKMYLMSNGVLVGSEVFKEWARRFGGQEISLSDYSSTNGFCAVTEEGIYINVPFKRGFGVSDATDAKLIYTGGGCFEIEWNGGRFPVKIPPPPRYHKGYLPSGVPNTSIGVTHNGDRVRIEPIDGCAWSCTFCSEGKGRKYIKRSKEDLLKVVRLAADDKVSPARHVLISGGTPRAEDESWMDDIYEYIAHRSPITVDVMMPPREKIGYPLWLKSLGVNMLSVNMEVWDRGRVQKVVPNKARIGRENYLKYIEESVRAFGIGFVQSLLLFGREIEPIESTLEGVKALVDLGCIPVLSPFRPDSRTHMGGKTAATIEEMVEVYNKTLEICEKSGLGIKPGPRCVACQHNTLSFPESDTNFYVRKWEDLTRWDR